MIHVTAALYKLQRTFQSSISLQYVKNGELLPGDDGTERKQNSKQEISCILSTEAPGFAEAAPGVV
ncbi:MAG: hypothetical protein C4323_01170 [Mastigocladus sp. ERB_26_2]